mgnify:CR=1 FL=1|jgi:hypothetical protein|tara:strand:- start:1706 stop:1921 length:216 start_codon:yes stop_codon:yes gene_type:complete
MKRSTSESLFDRIVEVDFVWPDSAKVLMMGHENITVESYKGLATAYVPASDIDQARAKLRAIIYPITEWLD